MNFIVKIHTIYLYFYYFFFIQSIFAVLIFTYFVGLHLIIVKITSTNASEGLSGPTETAAVGFLSKHR